MSGGLNNACSKIVDSVSERTIVRIKGIRNSFDTVIGNLMLSSRVANGFLDFANFLEYVRSKAFLLVVVHTSPHALGKKGLQLGTQI